MPDQAKNDDRQNARDAIIDAIGNGRLETARNGMIFYIRNYAPDAAMTSDVDAFLRAMGQASPEYAAGVAVEIIYSPLDDALKMQATRNLTALSLELSDPAEAAYNAWIAARNGAGLPREFAIDILLDQAKKILDTAQSALYLLEVMAMEDKDDRHQRALEYWASAVGRLRKTDEESALKVLKETSSRLAETAAGREAASLWSKIVGDMLAEDRNAAMKEIVDTAVNLDTSNPISGEAVKIYGREFRDQAARDFDTFWRNIIEAANEAQTYNVGPLRGEIALILLETSRNVEAWKKSALYPLTAVLTAYRLTDSGGALSGEIMRQYTAVMNEIMITDPDLGMREAVNTAADYAFRGDLEQEAVRLYMRKIDEIKGPDPYKAFNKLVEAADQLDKSPQLRLAMLHKFFEFTHRTNDSNLLYMGAWNASCLSDAHPDMEPYIIDRLLTASGLLLNHDLDKARKAASRAHEIAVHRHDAGLEAKALSALRRTGLGGPLPPGFQP